MPTANLGILAHVDAGKTTLTERLLYAAGVIDQPGSVDAGTTQTDSLALERQRGITIRSAVASFAIGDVTVNLVDTPGHPDFVAEVERALRVLDGAVLVISAVEGVQPQTRILLRVLRRLRVPTVLFVNKIDRRGAGYDEVLAAISDRLTEAIIPMGAVAGLGTPGAEFTAFDPADQGVRSRLIEVLADGDDAFLAAYLADDTSITYSRLRAELAAQTKQALVHPVFFGSAMTGAGVDALTAGVVELLPVATGDPDGPVSGRVFKIERGASKEKIAYVRMFSGTIRTRDRLRFGPGGEVKVTAVAVLAHGAGAAPVDLSAGQIGKVWGLRGIQVGDEIGQTSTRSQQHDFAPPTLETAILPRDPRDKPALRDALSQLAEQDPLINFRQDESQQLSVSLYGEVQREVIEATLAGDYAVEVEFRDSTVICVERPVRSGEALEVLNTPTNPFHATIGLRIDPAPAGTGIEFRASVDPQTMPLFLFRNAAGFTAAMDRHIRRTLHEGLFGWPVVDCVVSLVECGYSLADGPPAKRGPMPTHADIRSLVPLVVMGALERAGTVVCEPYLRVSVEVPSSAGNAAVRGVTRLGAAVDGQFSTGQLTTIHARLAAGRMPTFQRQLPLLSNGEGALESSLAGYQPVAGPPATRPRTMVNPLLRAEYMAALARQGTAE